MSSRLLGTSRDGSEAARFESLGSDSDSGFFAGDLKNPNILLFGRIQKEYKNAIFII